MSIPFKALFGNVMVGHGDAHAAIYRMDTCSYPYLPEVDKLQQLSALARFAYSIDANFSIYRCCRAYPASGYVRQAMGMLDARHQDPEPWQAFLQGHQDHLTGLSSFIPEIYVAVGLRVKGAPTAHGFADRLAAFGKRTNALIPGRDLDGLVASEDRVSRLASQLLPVRRATTREIQWLLRRAASRGLAEPKIDENWQPTALKVTTDDDREAYEPRRSDLVRHVNAPLDERSFSRGLVVRSEEGESFQAMLALGALPDTSEFPGSAELLYSPLEAVPFPVDAVLHVRRIANREAAKTVRNKVIDADNVYEDASGGSHGPLSYAPAENRDLARSLDSYVQDSSRPPLLDVAVSLAVGGATAQIVDDRVDLLEQQYGTVALHRPLGLQPALFRDHLPRPDGGKVRDYAAVLTIEQFGALIPHGVHHTGSQNGVYFARVVTGSNRPVKQDVTEATRRKRSPSIMVTGSLGSGKTVTGQLLALGAALRGSNVGLIDPKGDSNLEALPELAGQVEVLELSGAPEYAGMLDPLTIGPPGLREDLATSYLLEILPRDRPGRWDTQIAGAVKATLEGPSAPCCMRVLARLEKGGEDARAAGEALSVWADSGLGRLAFSNGSRIDTGTTARVTTIRPGGLSLPGPDVHRADYDRSERMSVATLNLVTSFAMRLVSGNRSVHKLLMVDEAWFMLGTPAGRRLIDRINHYGRTENATLILATQQLDEVAKIKDLIGTFIVHGQDSESQARLNLEMLGLDPGDNPSDEALRAYRGLVARLRGMRKGRALMKDLDSRVAEVQVDVVTPHILEALDVNQDPLRSNGKPRVTLEDVRR